MATCFTAGAQDTYYAELLSRNNYYGTARSVALGGAMTALGGDLGSITFNPAGSAVNDYSQFTITPGLLISTTKAYYDPTGKEVFDGATSTSKGRVNLPNIGLNLVFFSDDNSWITATSLGFIVNTTNTFLNYTTGRGVNPYTSFLGSMASAAESGGSFDRTGSLYASYYANQISEYGANNSGRFVGANEYLRADETGRYLPGALEQTAVYNTYGTKSDYVINMGFNVQDSFYFGFNLGIPCLKYTRQETFTEKAQNPEAHPVIFFDKDDKKVETNYISSKNMYALNSKAAGIYARFGFISLLGENLRIGAAIQSPALIEIEEDWGYKASSTFANTKFSEDSKSEDDGYSYNLRTPYIVDAGAALTIPEVGLLSVDYELTDYSVMKYSDIEPNMFGEDSWAVENYLNKTFCGVSHALRAGLEVKPADFLALRAGYSFVTNPEKYWIDLSDNIVTAETWYSYSQAPKEVKYFEGLTQAFSLGAGFSSPGSFFADFAVRLTKYPVSYFSPYYYGAYDAEDKNGNLLDVGAPIELLDHSIFDAILTVGWRF